jgi:hypothetical protein
VLRWQFAADPVHIAGTGTTVAPAAAGMTRVGGFVASIRGVKQTLATDAAWRAAVVQRLPNIKQTREEFVAAVSYLQGREGDEARARVPLLFKVGLDGTCFKFSVEYVP